MGRSKKYETTEITAEVLVEVSLDQVIDGFGIASIVEACVDEDTTEVFETINLDDFDEWRRDNGYAPSIDAAMLIDDRTSPVTAMAEVANEALKRHGSNVIADFANSDKLDSDVRSELVSVLWPSPEEIANRDDQWQHYLARIVSEFNHLYGTENVLAALREQNALQPGFRAAMEGTTREARLDAVSAKLDAVTEQPKQTFFQLAAEFDADAMETNGPTFVQSALADPELKDRFVRALRPEIEQDVKKGIFERIAAFVFGGGL